MEIKPWPKEHERILLADACVPGRHPNALWNYVRYGAGWHYRCIEKKKYWLTTHRHKPLLDWVGAQIDEWFDSRDRGLQERFQVLIWLFRTFGKTNMVTKCIPTYVSLRDPDVAVYIGGETHPKAIENLEPIKAALDGTDPHSNFAWLYGGVWFTKDRTWTKEKIVHAARRALGASEPSIGTFGVETGLTGKHPGVVLYDDPISEEKLKEGGTWLQAAVDSLDSIYPALENDSLFILVGTHYREEDPIGSVLARDGVKEWNGHEPPERYKQDGKWRVYFLQARDIHDKTNYPEGEPTAPETGWTDANLRDYKARKEPEYAAQMMGTPGLHGQMELTLDQIKNMHIKREEVPPCEYVTIHLDTAFKTDETRNRGDRNVILAWKHDLSRNGHIYLDRCDCSSAWKAEEFDDRLIAALTHYRSQGLRVRAITDEREMGGKRGVYLAHLQDVITEAGLRLPQILQLNRAGTKKVIRIREASNYWLEGYAHLIDDVDNLDVLSWEMARIGRSAHDDCADAAADVWLPEIWHRSSEGHDGQPNLPRQPGDDVLKGKVRREMKDIEYELKHGHSRKGGDDDYQPYEERLNNDSDSSW